jgi:glycosidase
VFSPKGDFASIHPHLERIRKLGTDIVWLTPIQPISQVDRKGSYGSPYAAYDYREVNPDLGTKDDLKRLADAIHSLGMKLMIDVVYNHTGVGSVLSKEHPEWFYRHDGKISRKFDEWSDVWDLDYSNNDLWDYQIETLHQWASLGVDGFRCDVATMVPAAFWVKARQSFIGKKDIIWLAESAHLHFLKSLREYGFTVSTDSELFEAFDMLYDYDGFEILDRYRVGTARLREYTNHVYAQTNMYPLTSLKMRFIENHDQPRAAFVCRGEDNLRNWTVFYQFLPGPMLVYAGQEIRETVQPNIFEKETIDWTRADIFSEFLQTVINSAKQVKKELPHFTISELCDGVYELNWKSSHAEHSAFVNLENRTGSIPVQRSVAGFNLLDGSHFTGEGSIRAELMPLVIKLL